MEVKEEKEDYEGLHWKNRYKETNQTITRLPAELRNTIGKLRVRCWDVIERRGGGGGGRKGE